MWYSVLSFHHGFQGWASDCQTYMASALTHRAILSTLCVLRLRQSHYIAQASLNLQSFHLNLPNARSIGMHHYTQLKKSPVFVPSIGQLEVRGFRLNLNGQIYEFQVTTALLQGRKVKPIQGCLWYILQEIHSIITNKTKLSEAEVGD